MDKQEYRDFLDEIKRNYDSGNYEQVVMYANEINISKLKDIRTLELISDSYDRLGRYDIARNVLEEVYNRLGGSRQLASRMCELCIKCDDLDTAIDYYDAFRQMAPRDSYQYLLKYQIGKAGGVPIKELIKVLETYREYEKDEKWEYELARLYHEAGRADECVELCDEIVVWFANGEYVKKALELKFMHTALSAKQQALYESMMSHVINNFIPEKNEQPEQPEEDAFYKTEGFDDYDQYDELIEAEHGERYLAPEDYEEIQNVYQNSISAKVASFRETQQKEQESGEGSSANPNVAVDLTDVRDIESDTRVIPLELLKEKIEQDEEKPRLVRAGEKAQTQAQEKAPEKKLPVSNLQAIASAHGWGPDRSEKEETAENPEEAFEVTENAEAPVKAEPEEMPEPEESTAEAEAPVETEVLDKAEETAEPSGEEVAETGEVQEIIEESDPDTELVNEEAAAPVIEPEKIDATKVIPSLRFLSERTGKREEIYTETERPAGGRRGSNISMEELRKLIRPGEVQNGEFGLFFTMEESKQQSPTEPVEETEEAIKASEPDTGSETEITAAREVLPEAAEGGGEEIEYVNIYPSSAAKTGTLVGIMSPLAKQITRPVLIQEEPEEEIQTESVPENEDSSVRVDVSEFLTSGESDGQIGINLEALAEDDREMTGQITLDQVFAEYSRKLEENKEQVAAIENERLKLIQQMVEQDRKNTELSDLDEEEAEEPAEEAAEEETIEEAAEEVTARVFEEEVPGYTEAYEYETYEEPAATEKAELTDETVGIPAETATATEEPEPVIDYAEIIEETMFDEVIPEPEIITEEPEIILGEQETPEEYAEPEEAEIVIEDAADGPVEEKISSIASRLFGALEEQETAVPSETVTRLFEEEDDAAAAAIAKFDMQKDADETETKKEFTGFIEIEQSVLAMLNAEDAENAEETVETADAVMSPFEKAMAAFEMNRAQRKADEETEPQEVIFPFDEITGFIKETDLESEEPEATEEWVRIEEEAPEAEEEAPEFEEELAEAEEEAPEFEEEAPEAEEEAPEFEEELAEAEEVSELEEETPEAEEEAPEFEEELAEAEEEAPEFEEEPAENEEVSEAEEELSENEDEPVETAEISAETEERAEDIQPEITEQSGDTAATSDLSKAAEVPEEESEAANEEAFEDADEEYERFAPVSELFPDEPEEEVEESDDDYREYDNDEETVAETAFPDEEDGYAGELTGYRLSETMRKEMYEFLLVDGMEENICNAIDSILSNKEQGDVTGGNLIITGDAKSGKTFLSVEIIKAVTEAMGQGSGKVAKVQAEALNGKNIEKVFEKIGDSDLIVENVGYLDDATLSDLFNNMEDGKAAGMVVFEGNQLAVESIFINFPYARDLFHTRLDVNELDLVQWAELGKRYAGEKGYSIEGLALLAFHAKISELNKPTVRLGYDDIRKLVDKAIARAGKRRGIKKIFTPNAGGEEGSYLKQLEESDFM